jgi:hypothetical protein
MDMQDKDFDELFRQKLDSFEIKPSAQVWDNITGEMNTGKRKKMLVPFFSIAASIIVLVTAGLLFIPHKASVTVKKPVPENIVKVKAGNTTIATAKNNNTVLKQPAALQTNSPVNRLASSVNKNAVKNNRIQAAQPGNSTNKTVINNNENMLAAEPQKREVITAVVPDSETPLTTDQHIDEHITFKTQPNLIAAKAQLMNRPDGTPVKAKRGIRNLGDIINVVVAKVDKRKDKLIVFSDKDDDDDANITGINLSVLKSKKDEDK